jgi:hypothetical protein
VKQKETGGAHNDEKTMCACIFSPIFAAGIESTKPKIKAELKKIAKKRIKKNLKAKFSLLFNLGLRRIGR